MRKSGKTHTKLFIKFVILSYQLQFETLTAAANRRKETLYLVSLMSTRLEINPLFQRRVATGCLQTVFPRT
jgi:hypothetical protein